MGKVLATSDRTNQNTTLHDRSEVLRLAEAFSESQVGFALLSGPSHIYQVANSRYKNLVARTELVGLTVAEALPEVVEQGFVKILDQVYTSGKGFAAREMRAVLRQKSFYLDFTYEAVLNESGLISGILVIVVDVTPQVLARQVADIERHKFETIFADSFTSMAITHGPSHIYEHANQSYRNLFDGRSLVDQPLLQALPELAGQPFPALFDQVFASGVPYKESEALAYLRRTAGGPLEERYFDQTYTRVTGLEGEAYGVFVHAFEVTERVLARRLIQESEAQLKIAKELAEQANAAKSSFLANMSHEIRTPLGAIMGFVGLIKDENVNRKDLENYLSVIERNSTQLLRIIDDILDLSKVEAGMLRTESVDFSLVELMSDFSSLMGFRAREKGIIFDLKAKTALPESVRSDPTRLRQILTNIVGNAIKFTEHGRVELNISYHNGEIEFEVLDTGRGISPEQERDLFQPFSQGDVSITRKFGGTGLGLVLTRRLSEALGGQFDLRESVLGKGSAFVARIPVGVNEGVKMISALGYAPMLRSRSTVAGKLHGLKILLVEDSPDNQALISILLTKAGATIDIASDGEAGIDSALKGKYDLVLMDVQMPVMDGITAVRALRAQGYAKPVIALTAHAMKEERERCLQAGFTDFLSKPIQREQLIDLLIRETQPKA